MKRTQEQIEPQAESEALARARRQFLERTATMGGEVLASYHAEAAADALATHAQVLPRTTRHVND